jgi:uncharacterized LabA/DUF88 family protein
MINKKNNFAFIDSQNLYLGIKEIGWNLDYKRFRIYLLEKYGVTRAFMFLGYIPENQELYNSLQEFGYILVFKPIVKDNKGEVKGNIDAELVLHAMIEYENYTKAVIVTGDGDFNCLVNYLVRQDKLESILAPNRHRCSALLKFKKFRQHLRYMNELQNRLAYKQRSPHKDGTS